VDALRLFAWGAESRVPSAPIIRFEEVREASIHGCVAPEKSGAYLQVGGRTSARIRLFANELGAAAKAVELNPDVPPEAVIVSGPAGQ
jgi:hypothetical protein